MDGAPADPQEGIRATLTDDIALYGRGGAPPGDVTFVLNFGTVVAR